jgi:arylsulfatase A-like enzyme
MIDHDKNVGAVLAKLDELGIADNTIVMYGTDNGPHALRRTSAASVPPYVSNPGIPLLLVDSVTRIAGHWISRANPTS